MADSIEELIKALATAEAAVAGSDPYASPQRAVEGIQWNPSGFGVGENAAASGIKGLLSGLFGELGNDYKQRAADEYKQVLQASMQKQQVPNEVLPKGLFSKAQGIGDMFNQLSARELLLADQEAEKKRKEKLADRIAGLEDFESREKFKATLEEGDNPTAKEKAALDKSLDFIDEGFEKAKKLTGWSMVPGSASSNLLEGLRTSMMYQADKILGKEINTEERKNLIKGLMPSASDIRSGTLNQKRDQMKAFIKSLSAAPTSSASKTAPSKEEARAELARRRAQKGQ